MEFIELGEPIRITGCSGMYVPFIRYSNGEFRAVRAASEMGELILRTVTNGERIPDEYKTRIWNEARLCAVSEVSA